MSLIDNHQESHLEENLITFTNLMREEGLPVSTTEMMDALQALQKIDLFSRDDFKNTLQATLVKNRRDQSFFDRLFDYFFASPEKQRSDSEKALYYKKKYKQNIDQAASEMKFKGENLQLTHAELSQYSSMSQEERERLQNFMHKTETGVNVEPRFRPLLESIVKSHLRYCRLKSNYAKINNSSGNEDQNGGTAPGGYGAGVGSADAALVEMDIQAIKTTDLPEAEQLLQKLSRKLAVQILRRHRTGPRSGPLDLHRSLRDNMCCGGSIFNLKYKPRRRLRQQILLLCDVSASMKQYSTFAIHFLHGLREAVRDLSCFSFSDNLENMTPELKSRPGLQHLLDLAIRRNKAWGGGTNLGLSLKELMEKYPDLLNRRTSIIVVSDTKTVSIDYALKELNKLNDRVKRIIWLNPMPKEQWPDYRSTGFIAGMVEMWPCSTIAQLEEVLTGRL